MFVQSVRNVNEALYEGLMLLTNYKSHTCSEQTRVGPVLSMDAPVATVTRNPVHRVLFSPVRNANPFFHLFESLWMLAGRNDLPWLAQFNKRMATYSDDGGTTQPGAYGFRWRKHFGYDQIEEIVEMLSTDPKSRRAVLTMWDGWGIHQYPDGTYQMNGDLLSAKASADVPCNTQCYFRILDGALHMTVCCRSNDLWWGAHGANAVHFSVLLEYMAARIGVKVGTMTQLSNNYHIYTDVVGGDLVGLAHDANLYDLYNAKGAGLASVAATPMFGDVASFDADLPLFIDYLDPMANPIDLTQNRRKMDIEPTNPFLRDVALPMARAWDARKIGDYAAAVEFCERVGAENSDWRVASRTWILRAKTRREGGVA